MIAKSAPSPDLLTAPESARRAELEETIEKHITGFREAGAALAEIRDSRLYRNTHATFEDYCRGVWSISKSHANRLVQSAAVMGTLAPNGAAPANEAQARELAKVPAEDRAAVMADAAARAEADGGTVRARHIAEAAQAHTFGDIPETPEPTAAADDDEPADEKPGRSYVDAAPFMALEEEEAKRPRASVPQDDPGTLVLKVSHPRAVAEQLAARFDAGFLRKLAAELVTAAVAK